MYQSQQGKSSEKTLEDVTAELGQVDKVLDALSEHKKTLAGEIAKITTLQKAADELSVHVRLANAGILDDTRDASNDCKTTQEICNGYNSSLVTVTLGTEAIKKNSLFSDMNLLPLTRLPLPSQHPTEKNYGTVLDTVSQSAKSLNEILKQININITNQHRDLGATKSKLQTEKAQKEILQGLPQEPPAAYRGGRK